MASSCSGEVVKAQTIVEDSVVFSKMNLVATFSNNNRDITATDFTRITANYEIMTSLNTVKIDASSQKIMSTKRQTINKGNGKCVQPSVVTVFDGHDVIQTSIHSNPGSLSEVVRLNVSGHAKTMVIPTLHDWRTVKATYYRDYNDLRNESELVDNGFGIKESESLAGVRARYITPVINENGRTSVSNIDIDDYISIFAQSYLGQSNIEGHSVAGILEIVSSGSDRSAISYTAVLPGETKNTVSVGAQRWARS